MNHRNANYLLGCAALAGLGFWQLDAAHSSPSQPDKAVKNTAAKAAKNALGGLTFRDLSGKTYGPAELGAHKATVFLFTSTQCPVSNVYAPRFAALAETYGKQGAQVFAVYANAQESLAEISRSAQQRGLTFPVVKDAQGALATRLGATMTPQAVVVDAGGIVRYRGRIDDNPVATRVTARDLNDALDAVLAGRAVAHPQTVALGCTIRRTVAPIVVAPGTPTYAVNVAPILRAKCEGCHRPGEVAPFSLQTYAQASAWAKDIARYTQNGLMPPWKPAPNYGEFLEAHDRQLNEIERATLAKWADAGAPQGDPKRTPAPRHFTQGWQLGEPDAVLTPARAFHLTADGEDVYRNFVVKTNFSEDRYLSAVEIRAGNSAIVHHVINYIDSRGVSDKLEGKENDGQPGYTSFGGPGFLPTGILGGWAPGNDPHWLPDGVAMKLPKGARVVIQVHYHKDGKPETDQTRIGLHFTRKPVDKLVRGAMPVNFLFRIPAGESRYKVEATSIISEDSHALAVTPHMHLLGREMKVWATLPDATEIPLVWIKDWDFNWQATYYLKQPVALPKGTKVHLTAYYDNSPGNPRNPLPNQARTVGWGEQTTDEMCIAFLTTTHDAEHLAQIPPSAPPRAALR